MPLGKYGLLRRHYLEENRPGLYTRLMLSGKLMEHLQEIEQTAQNRLERLMILLPKQNGVTEELKATNQMAWVAQMNSLKHQAEELILSELIYS
ncbi:MAG: TnpV protein [Christensenellales bacterium]